MAEIVKKKLWPKFLSLFLAIMMITGTVVYGSWAASAPVGVVKIASLATAGEDGIESEEDAMAKAIVAAAPYVDLSEKNIATFDVAEAKKGGLSDSEIDFVIIYIEMQNQLMESLNKGALDQGLDEKMSKQFEPFFRRAARRGLQDIPKNKKAVDTSAMVAMALPIACGGSSERPHPCPPRLSTSFTSTSRANVVARLIYLGYHKTLDYACGGNQNDYSVVVSAYSCNNGPFRRQAIISGSGTRWTYTTQSPEPNPELTLYTWPAYWWGGYVRWWHLDYC